MLKIFPATYFSVLRHTVASKRIIDLSRSNLAPIILTSINSQFLNKNLLPYVTNDQRRLYLHSLQMRLYGSHRRGNHQSRKYFKRLLQLSVGITIGVVGADLIWDNSLCRKTIEEQIPQISPAFSVSSICFKRATKILNQYINKTTAWIEFCKQASKESNQEHSSFINNNKNTSYFDSSRSTDKNIFVDIPAPDPCTKQANVSVQTQEEDSLPTSGRLNGSFSEDDNEAFLDAESTNDHKLQSSFTENSNDSLKSFQKPSSTDAIDHHDDTSVDAFKEIEELDQTDNLSAIIRKLVAQHEKLDALRQRNLELELSCQAAEWQERAQLLIEDALQEEQQKFNTKLTHALQEQKKLFLQETENAVTDVAALKSLLEKINEMLNSHNATLDNASRAYKKMQHLLNIDELFIEGSPIGQTLTALKNDSEDDTLISTIIEGIPENIRAKLDFVPILWHESLKNLFHPCYKDAAQASYIIGKGGIIAHIGAAFLCNIDRLLGTVNCNCSLPVFCRPECANHNIPILKYAAQLCAIGQFEECCTLLNKMKGLPKTLMEQWIIEAQAVCAVTTALKALRAHLKASILNQSLQSSIEKINKQ